jgi:hypothetical protein
MMKLEIVFIEPIVQYFLPLRIVHIIDGVGDALIVVERC